MVGRGHIARRSLASLCWNLLRHYCAVLRAIDHCLLLKQLRRDPWSLGGQQLQLVVAVNRLLHLGHPATCIYVSALNSLEVDNSSFVQVVELRVMPVSLGAAKVLLVGPCSLVGRANHRNVVLNIFQWKIQLQVICLLRSPLVVGLGSRCWRDRVLRVV